MLSVALGMVMNFEPSLLVYFEEVFAAAEEEAVFWAVCWRDFAGIPISWGRYQGTCELNSLDYNSSTSTDRTWRNRSKDWTSGKRSDRTYQE